MAVSLVLAWRSDDATNISIFVPAKISLDPSQVFKEDKYLKEATECAEVIWQRGLLRKGYGICHGTAGNGYAFLSLYKLTQEKKHLYRSCKVRTLPSFFSRSVVESRGSSDHLCLEQLLS